YPFSKWTSTCAVKRGHFSVLQWLIKNGCPWGIPTTNAAARYGYLEILMWLLRNRCPYNLIQLYCSAAEGGKVYILDFLIKTSPCTWNESITANAAKGGNLCALKW